MSELIRFTLDNGGSVLVRQITVAPSRDVGGPIRTGRSSDRVGEQIREASQTLQTALTPVVSISQALSEQLRKVSPQSIEVEFGVELSAEAGALLAQVSGGCHLQVKLIWSRDEGPENDSGVSRAR